MRQICCKDMKTDLYPPLHSIHFSPWRMCQHVCSKPHSWMDGALTPKCKLFNVLTWKLHSRGLWKVLHIIRLPSSSACLQLRILFHFCVESLNGQIFYFLCQHVFEIILKCRPFTQIIFLLAAFFWILLYTRPTGRLLFTLPVHGYVEVCIFLENQVWFQ